MPITWRERISSIRIDFMTDTRMQFLSVVATQLKVINTTDPGVWSGPPVDTMATDGEHLLVNPDFLMALSPGEAKFVVAHEVLHAALLHPFRLFGRDQELANIAMDYVINLLLSDMGFAKERPGIALYDTKWRNKAWDEVYAELAKQKKGQRPSMPKGAGKVLPHGSGVKDAKGTTEAEASMRRIAAQAAQAVKSAQGIGALPGELARLLQNARPVLDWRVVLRNFLSSANSKVEDWARPSRRVGSYLGGGGTGDGGDVQISLPGYRREGFGHLVFAVDTSGSVNIPQLSSCMAEMRSACSEAGLSSVSVVYADARVAATYHVDLEAGEELSERTCPPRGGGGTDFAPTFKWINEDMRARECIGVVYFTDLQCHSFGVPPPYPVMWLVHGPEASANTHIPLAESAFGQAVRMPMDA